MNNGEEKNLQELCGTVEDITFRNEENGFTVLEISNGDELITVVGIMPELFAGEELCMHGVWQSHPTFGRQFKAELCERHLPAGADAIFRYLSSGAIKGIGPVLAGRIVEKFGDQTLEIMEKEPMRLSEVEGISKSKAEKISENFKEQFGIREAMIFFGNYGITPAESLRIWKRWGTFSTERIKENPYLLCSSGLRISFERADAIAMSMEYSQQNSNRIQAGLIYVLRHNSTNGHTCLPFEKLCEVTAKMLGLDIDEVKEVCETTVISRELVSQNIGEKRFIFLSKAYDAERYSAGRLKLTAQFPPQKITDYKDDIKQSEFNKDIKYDEQQKKAIALAMEQGLLVLTGGPGTGKTTTLNAIIEIFENKGLDVALAAPTGRAAKRMCEVTGREAKTVHRLLEAEYSDDDNSVFVRDESNQLTCDALIVDEISMMDVFLLQSLLKATPIKCRIILVGDSDQLPSVGAGNVLFDILASGVIPSVKLTEIFRQSCQSAIVTNAHKIVSGEMPDLTLKSSDFFFLRGNEPAYIAETIVGLCSHRLKNAYGYSPMHDIQVLCPGKKGMCGTVELNRRLQNTLNPPGNNKRELTHGALILREGDKVMQIKNNYDIEWTKEDGSDGSGVFNGDIGILTHIDRTAGSVTVDFDGRLATYPIDGVGDLDLSYAITVHKSQGSEFEAVIMPAYPGPIQLYFRNLLYTAVTRAKKLLIIVGKESTVEQMVENNKKTRRYTALAEFLKDEM